MPVTLQKGQRVSLAKEAPGLKRCRVGLGWDVKQTDGGLDFDLDASILLVGSDNKLCSDKHFVFYNNLESPDGSVKHIGDNLTGQGEGDDEVLLIDFSKLSSMICKIVVVVSVYESEQRKQNFGQVRNAFIRLVNEDSQAEILRYDLTEDYSLETSMIMGEFYLKDGEWRFAAVGSGFTGGLGPLLATYGVQP